MQLGGSSGGRGGAPLTSSEAPAAPTAARQRQRAAARGGRRARRRWQADRHPASVSACWAVVCEPHGACQRRAGPVPSGMSVRYLATSVLRASRRCQSRAEQAVAEAEDAARDGPWKTFRLNVCPVTVHIMTGVAGGPPVRWLLIYIIASGAMPRAYLRLLARRAAPSAGLVQSAPERGALARSWRLPSRESRPVWGCLDLGTWPTP